MPWDSLPPTQEEMRNTKQGRWDEKPPTPEEIQKSVKAPIDLTNKTPWQYAKETAGGLIEGANEGIPGSGLLDKASAASYAGQQAVADMFRDKENQQPFASRYQKVLDDVAAQRAEAKAKSPIAYGAGNLVGTVGGSMAVPIPGAGMAGLGGAAARIGSIASINALDVGTRNKDQAFDPEAAIKSVPMSLAGGAFGEGVGKVVSEASPVAKKLSNWFGDKAETRAVKAMSGQNKAGLKALDAAGHIDLENGGSDLGRALLTPDAMGDRVIDRWTGTTPNIARKAGLRSKALGKEFGNVIDTVDVVNPNAVGGRNIGENIRDEARTISRVDDNIPIIDKMEKQAANYDEMSEMGAAESMDFKNGHKWKNGADPGAPGSKTPKEVTNDFKRGVGDEIKRAVKDTAQNKMPAAIEAESPGPVRDLLENRKESMDNFPDISRNYGLMTEASDLAHQRSLGDLSNRMVRPSSHGVGAAAGVMGAAAGHGLPVAGMMSGVGTALNNVLLSRGNAFSARGLDDIANSLAKFPQYAKILEDAARRGNSSLAVTHTLLMKQDPAYKAEFEK